MPARDFGDVKLPDFFKLPPLHHMLRLPEAKLKELKLLDKRIGVTFGAFDILHAGHMAMFAEAKLKGVCEYLFVGIQSNPRLDRPTKNPPSETLLERHIRVDSNKYVDAYAMYDTEAELEQFLRKYARKSGGFIDVRILDAEYRTKEYTGKGLPLDVYYNWRDHPWSTSTLKLRIHEDVESQRTAA